MNTPKAVSTAHTSNIELYKTANKQASFIAEAMLDRKADDGKTYGKIKELNILTPNQHKEYYIMQSNTIHTVLSSICPCPTTMLADFYQVKPKEILQKFNDHRERFVAGEHYTVLVGKDNYLWTERGALNFAKLLTTRRAWEVWKMLAKVGADRVFADLFGADVG